MRVAKNEEKKQPFLENIKKQLILKLCSHWNEIQWAEKVLNIAESVWVQGIENGHLMRPGCIIKIK